MKTGNRNAIRPHPIPHTQNYDMIASERIEGAKNYYDTYAEAHNISDLLEVKKSMEMLYPDYLSDFEQALSLHALYSGNLLIMRKEDYGAYCQWLFDILFDVTKRIDASNYNLYEMKAQGFLAEGLLYVWTAHNHKRVYEAPIGYTDEKAETKELKLAIGQLLKQGQFDAAEEMFNQIMNLRPDISLPMSDIRREIPVIQ